MASKSVSVSGPVDIESTAKQPVAGTDDVSSQRLYQCPGRIYIVEPTGPIMDDPNLTDKKYPGNPTKSYRSREPLGVAGEVRDWEGHSPEALKAMKDHIERLRQLGVEAIDD